MVDYAEILLKLQLQEVHCHIRNHVGKGRKYPQFLSLMFLLSGYHADTPITINAEAIHEADSRIH